MSWLRLMEQNIKQYESAPVEVSAEEVKNKPPLKKNKVLSLIKEMWPAYLIEVFVIILGISMTLALEKWRDNNKEEQLEKIYQKNLLADVEVDSRSLDYAITSTQKLLDKGNELLTNLKNLQANNISSNQIYTDLQSILGRPNFRSSDATFSDLKNSGNLHLLKDIQLKNSLFAYYSEAQNIKELQDAEQLATINISGPYFLKRFPMEDTLNKQALTSSNSMGDLSKSIEFKNNVLLRVKNREELLIQYQNADALSTQLKHALLAKAND